MSPTRVVNIRMDDFDIYIGRPGRGQPGPWGNPFLLSGYVGTHAERRQQCLDAYQAWLLARLEREPDLRQRLLALRGKRLGCFCPPKGGVTASDHPWICHGQVLAAYLDILPEDV